MFEYDTGSAHTAESREAVVAGRVDAGRPVARVRPPVVALAAAHGVAAHQYERATADIPEGGLDSAPHEAGARAARAHGALGVRRGDREPGQRVLSARFWICGRCWCWRYGGLRAIVPACVREQRRRVAGQRVAHETAAGERADADAAAAAGADEWPALRLLPVARLPQRTLP